LKLLHKMNSQKELQHTSQTSKVESSNLTQPRL
jgi:hypothetical protein